MNYSAYYPTDYVNGEGTRCVLFVSGCSHMCKGCYNQSTWNPCSGKPFSKGLEDQIIRDLNDSRIKRDGLSLSGGDPMHKANLVGLIKLCKRVKRECPGKTIWLWTGYTIEQIYDENNYHRMELLELIDVLVDGKFEQDLKDPSLAFRGSSNQRIILLAK